MPRDEDFQGEGYDGELEKRSGFVYDLPETDAAARPVTAAMVATAKAATTAEAAMVATAEAATTAALIQTETLHKFAVNIGFLSDRVHIVRQEVLEVDAVDDALGERRFNDCVLTCIPELIHE